MLHNKIVGACAILIGITLGQCTALTAQDDLELIEQFGIKSVTTTTAKTALAGLRWQSLVNEKQAELIREIKDRWQHDYEKNATREKALREHLSKQGVASNLTDQSIRDLEVEIMKERGRVEGLRAKIRELETEMKILQQTSKTELDSLKTDIQAARMKIDLANGEYKKTESLHQRGATTSQELQRAKYTLMISELELKKIEDQAQQVESQGMVQVQLQMSAAQTELAVLEKHYEQLKHQRAQTEDAMQQLNNDMTEFRRDLALDMIGQAQKREMELELDNTRNLALIQMIEMELSQKKQDD